MNILILNSDSPNNMGDAAILFGNVSLIRKVWPNAEITAISEFPNRDQKIFGIDFIKSKVYTINPYSIIKIAVLSKSYDLVLWGGGELLKDYTNILGNVYWFLRILSVRIFNKKIAGAFQGIGETNSVISRFFIRRAVSCCQTFAVRDNESYKKLVSWGVSTKLINSYDPAIMCADELGNEASKVDTGGAVVGIGARNWFHYRQGGIIPYKFRNFGFQKQASKENARYVERLSLVLDMIIEKYDVDILFFPMFNSLKEGDDSFSFVIKSRMRHASRVRVVKKEGMSPVEYLRCMSHLKAFIGVRLHSAILAACSRIPFSILYYSDKGRVFSEQMGMGSYAMSLNEFTQVQDMEKMLDAIGVMMNEKERIGFSIDRKISEIKTSIEKDFRDMVSYIK